MRIDVIVMNIINAMTEPSLQTRNMSLTLKRHCNTGFFG